MGAGRIQRSFLSVAAIFTGLSTAVAAPSLDESAQTEFAKAGSAKREQLEREAAGDPNGARLAADDAELHRNQYRYLMRELTRSRPDAPGTVVPASWDLYGRQREPEGSTSTGTAWRADAIAKETEDRVALRGNLYSTGQHTGVWGGVPEKGRGQLPSRGRSNEPFLVDRQKAAADADHP